MEEDIKRRSELASFLKSRRERLSPTVYGIHVNSRRRAKGLRREEVADMAGVSSIWYTWLEQGRAVRASTQVLDSLSNTFQLRPDERVHLYALAGVRQTIDADVVTSDHSTLLQKILDKLEPYPAHIRGPRWDTIAWNASASRLYGGFEGMDGLERNSLWRMFTRPDYPTLLPDWSQLAQNLLAQFRASYAQHVGEPKFEELIQLLKDTSGEFAEWWENHDVLGLPVGKKIFHHPTLGHLIFEHQTLVVPDYPDLKLTVYIPVS